MENVLYQNFKKEGLSLAQAQREYEKRLSPYMTERFGLPIEVVGNCAWVDIGAQRRLVSAYSSDSDLRGLCNIQLHLQSDEAIMEAIKEGQANTEKLMALRAMLQDLMTEDPAEESTPQEVPDGDTHNNH